MSIKNRYNEIIKTPIVEKEIKAYLPQLTDKDYQRGYVRRYFLQKTNDKGSPIFELSQSKKGQFLSNPLYTVVDIKWRIRGPKEVVYGDSGLIRDKSVSGSNMIAIKLVSHLIPNLKLYLPNLLQFYKS
tara:strand:- start:1470 stop:1856 length:387 start_codon:yes stop_codon:yes gene_type:complete